jgi:hypothetical protein
MWTARGSADALDVTALAVFADPGFGPDPTRSDTARLVVTDADDVVVGWVELASGHRHVGDPARAEEFEDAVDLWLELVGGAAKPPARPAPRHQLRVTETRFPDPPVRRSLVIPLLHL